VEAYNLYRKLRERQDIEVRALSSRTNDLEGHNAVSVICPGGLGPLYFSVKVSGIIEKLVAEYRLDLIQVYGGPGGIFLFKKPKVPLIYLANHTYSQQYRFLGKNYYKTLSRLERKGYMLAEKIVAISNTTRDSLVEDYGISEERIEVITPGFDREKFKPLELQRIPSSILFVGRLCPRKGIDYLLESISIVKMEIPGIKLYIAGDGSLRKKLARTVRQNRLDSNVFFLGKISDNELVEWYNRVQVFVLPSLFEGFGIVCLEAMACGTPVIATRVPGVVDVVRDEFPNRLVPSGDPRSLTDAIIKFFKEEKLEKYRWVPPVEELEKFDWDKICERFVNIYNEILLK